VPHLEEQVQRLAPMQDRMLERGYAIAYVNYRNEVPHLYGRTERARNLPDDMSGGENRTLKSSPTLDSDGSRGLAARYPIAGAAFLVGSLGVLGVPPTLGYAGHWRLFAAAAGQSPALLVVIALATILTLFAYARVTAVCWWGPGAGAKAREPVAQSVALGLLGIALLAAGVWPALLGSWLVR
jgi:hypothetical protein